ncbi:MAG TPA: LptF/LptG family permease [Tepidisphaeraceae bacterium]|jgi:lipopolysaccharide export LptBFGC system permease protein LptF|nr:LptF/LptG family permease [Tepidisphaeraceae bacterium]
MKLIDRYVTITFLKNYLISFLVLVGMYIVLDLIFNIDELAEIKQKSTGLEAMVTFIAYIADFYFYQIFLYFLHLSGMIAVVAASFTLMRMIRFNELSALLSAGVPLLRVAMPIIIAALFLNGLIWLDQELLIPNMIHKLVRKHDYGTETDSRSFKVDAMRAEDGAKLFAARYHPNTEKPPKMEMISIIDQDENYRPTTHIRADSATWDELNKQWTLENGWIDRNLSPESGKSVKSERIYTYKGRITPEEIMLYRSGNFVELLSTQRINELLQRPLSYGRGNLLRVKHTRGVTQMTINMILLLLAISAVLTREPQQLKTSATRAIILTGMLMTAAFASQELAGQPPANLMLADKWPALMAWLPIFIFGPLSVILLDKVKT